ncbi:uncharacterized protein BO97DRAFT_422622 [Aspergillus homomorphus CBS 101889]|uniref:Methyltransferase type 11 domain-containing protein n=1 Tax=Aspergillus homomorphus (strain CBS 101889) TaxID=1450537 RepID=A0A395I3R7_ASPHC|nr:hypothetical protein BO97DRAFT_422622 [Aspergillus homomorphus CBS 101889]RAL14730.1 hypothetical protein BO97DRAFT_422622 [Aspergillus homomorphus CBS 101889]
MSERDSSHIPLPSSAPIHVSVPSGFSKSPFAILPRILRSSPARRTPRTSAWIWDAPWAQTSDSLSTKEPPNLYYGSDLYSEFIELGYDLLADCDTLACQLITSDIFNDRSELFQYLGEKVDMINAASFFHLFDWDTQVKLAKQVIKLLKPKPGSIRVGI